MVVILEEQRLTGKKVAIPTGIAVSPHKLLMGILEWAITEVIGVDLSFAIVITTGLVQLMHHSLLEVVEHLKQWLSAGCVVDVGEFHMALGDKVLRLLIVELLVVDKVELVVQVL